MLRQRRGTGVLEPLLGGDAGAASGTQESASRLWTIVAPFCTLVVTAATAAAAYLLWCAPSEAPLSDDEEEAVERLRERALLPFDAANETHVALLHTLWARAFPERPLPAPRGAHWGDLGWQGHDPATDLRAAGHLAATALVYFSERHTAAFQRLMMKSDGTRAAWEYPFAVGGVNLVAALVDALGVAALLPKRAKGAAPPPPNRSFAALQARHPHAFEELFCAAFIRLDAEWLTAKASYMDFNDICGRAVAAALAALDAGDDIASVCAALTRV